MKKTGNFLEYVPIPKKGMKYDITEGKVTIYQENKGLFNWIAQKCFKRPRISQIHLDEMGNFVWPLMDGERNIQALAECMKEQFGEKAEPLYPRAAQYFRTLETYGFVEFLPKE